ncbi:DUF4372 domain-containing protein [bacterium]|nr:DUF4372 domain-containing protein [bacterium]
MQKDNTIIGKLLSGINRKKFKRIVDKYNGEHHSSISKYVLNAFPI